jgi:hypothetical protein
MRYYLHASGKETDLLTTIHICKAEGEYYNPTKDAVVRSVEVHRSKAADTLHKMRAEVERLNGVTT